MMSNSFDEINENAEAEWTLRWADEIQALMANTDQTPVLDDLKKENYKVQDEEENENDSKITKDEYIKNMLEKIDQRLEAIEKRHALLAEREENARAT